MKKWLIILVILLLLISIGFNVEQYFNSKNEKYVRMGEIAEADWSRLQMLETNNNNSCEDKLDLISESLFSSYWISYNFKYLEDKYGKDPTWYDFGDELSKERERYLYDRDYTCSESAYLCLDSDRLYVSWSGSSSYDDTDIVIRNPGDETITFNLLSEPEDVCMFADTGMEESNGYSLSSGQAISIPLFVNTKTLNQGTYKCIITSVGLSEEETLVLDIFVV